MRRSSFVSIAFVIAFSFAADAQPATCPRLVSEALIAVGNACGGIGRNEACYGNLRLTATPRDESVSLDFEEAGDVAEVVDIAALQLAALSEESSEWGVALMALQANLPDSLPGQNATIVLFGDVELENRGGEAPPLPDVFVTGGNVNVRQSPSTSASVVGRIGSDRQRAVGRLADGSWLRVALEDGTDGWVSASVVTAEGDTALLPESLPDDPPPSAVSYGPMQAFRLRTGIGVPQCSEAPLSGILIQTPEGAAEVIFEINKVSVTLGSTAVARTTEGTMRIALLEGRADVSAGGRGGVIRAGRVGIFDLDANGDATGDYTIEDYTPEDIASLPLVLLPEAVDTTVQDTTVPANGRWQFNSSVSGQSTCAGATGMIPDSSEILTFAVSEDNMLTHNYGTMMQGDDGVWRGEVIMEGHASTVEFTFEGESGTGLFVSPSDFGQGPCNVVFDITLEYLGP